ncbi:MAG TPA: ABC transporter permease [Longimicrobiales bacterium]|nr:ABC transporter permease [Longimicrobiales bacterium]
MRSALALARASWQAAASYRLRLLLSMLSLAVSIVPLYFVANALQPVMAESIATEGGQYFGFMVLGMVTFLLLPAAVNGLPGEVGAGIKTGTFEALLGTPARLPEVLGGMVGFTIGWSTLRAAALLLGGLILGANILPSHLLFAIPILALIVLSYLPFGIVASALIIAFRTSGPLQKAVLTGSALLGGVYYPTSVIPSWIQDVSGLVPLTYGLRALRMTVLEGAPLSAVLPDLAILATMTLGLFGLAWLALLRALRYARREGTLAQY